MDIKVTPRFCPTCNSERQYSLEFDAYYCEQCNAWLEEKCNDLGCEFCSLRPEKPSQVQPIE